MSHAERTRPAVEVQGLVKVFGATRAVDGIDLEVPAGSVYGVLGPNGAGKTTTLRMLATLLRPDAGTAHVFGHHIVTEADAVRSCVSLTGQFASIDEDLTGAENLRLLSRLLGFSRPAARERADELLAAFGLEDAAGRQVKKYSGGMRRRIDVAASIVVTPRLLFLDEPTTGLDPRSRNQVWDIVRALVADGTTVLLTTQYLEEADQLADRIAVIDHGVVIAEGTSGELKASVGAGALHVRLVASADRPLAQRLLSDVLGVPVLLDSEPVALSARILLEGGPGGLRGAGTDSAAQVARGLGALAEAGIAVSDFSLGQPSLDEVFLALTGHHAERTQPRQDDDREVVA
jgi:ABC-2 type transport system ATP-binding protein